MNEGDWENDEDISRDEVLLSSSDGSDIYHNTGASLFQKRRESHTGRLANYSDEEREGRRNELDEELWLDCEQLTQV